MKNEINEPSDAIARTRIVKPDAVSCNSRRVFLFCHPCPPFFFFIYALGIFAPPLLRNHFIFFIRWNNKEIGFIETTDDLQKSFLFAGIDTMKSFHWNQNSKVRKICKLRFETKPKCASKLFCNRIQRNQHCLSRTITNARPLRSVKLWMNNIFLVHSTATGIFYSKTWENPWENLCKNFVRLLGFPYRILNFPPKLSGYRIIVH